MATENEVHDPFSDHAAIANDHGLTESTLNVGRNATLTLGTDALIVLGMFAYEMAGLTNVSDDGLRDPRPRCCGLLHQRMYSAHVTRRFDEFQVPQIPDRYHTSTSYGLKPVKST